MTAAGMSRASLLARQFAATRAYTLTLLDGLTAEDCMVQSMPEASPVKWHLGHTTWFFETFVLAALADPPPPFDPAFRLLFNSYYVALGVRHLRAARGVLSRPPLDVVLAWRRQVDTLLDQRLQSGDMSDALLDLVVLGIQHEQQHQELILSDIKHHFWCNPLRPAWRAPDDLATDPGPLTFVHLEGGLVEIGHAGAGFCFDNERARHRVCVAPFALAARNISNGEFLAFIQDGGYRRPDLWLSDGWDLVQREAWLAPLYWRCGDDQAHVYTEAGECVLDVNAPLTHVSYYEAEAFARWRGCRLPTEVEWEHAATSRADIPGLFGEVWQWTSSAYLPYPGYVTAAGAVGEYNGKFMVNQMVLRGSSRATPPGHARPSYRNFFPPQTRWQFAGIRLAGVV